MKTCLYSILVIFILGAVFGCAHKPITPPSIEQPPARYNTSKLNSKWGIIELVLPEQVPPDTFWSEFAIAEPTIIKGDIGLVTHRDAQSNDYGLVVNLTKPHIYGLIKIDPDYNISHWIYENGIPLPCGSLKFFEHLGIEPQYNFHESIFSQEV